MTGTKPADSMAAIVAAIVALIKSGRAAQLSEADLREYVAWLLR